MELATVQILYLTDQVSQLLKGAISLLCFHVQGHVECIEWGMYVTESVTQTSPLILSLGKSSCVNATTL